MFLHKKLRSKVIEEEEEEKNGYDRRQTPLPRHSLLSQLLPVRLEVAHFFIGY